MLYLIKFILISQILSVLTYTNHSSINIKLPIKSYDNIHAASLSTAPIKYNEIKSELSESEQIKFNRVKKKIKYELTKKIKYKLEESIIEIYESSNEYWLVHQSIYDDILTLYIFEVKGKYMEVYEYELSAKNLRKLLEKKKKEKMNDYFIEIS
jgi:hypothetical protein